MLGEALDTGAVWRAWKLYKDKIQSEMLSGEDGETSFFKYLFYFLYILFYILFLCVVLIMFLCLLSAPICQNKFLVGVSLLVTAASEIQCSFEWEHF